MFDFGFWELSLIGLIALIVLGPERLPGVARTVGHWVGRARRMMSEVKADIDREIRNTELKEMESLKKDIEKTGREISGELSKASSGVDKKIKDEFDLSEAIQDSANSIGKDTPASSKSESDAKK